MPRRVTEEELFVRERWASWLGRFVGDGKIISASTLDKAMARKGRGAWQVYNWLRGENTAQADSVCRVGEALRAYGVAWSSAPVALYAAGYVGNFYGLIGALLHGARGDLAQRALSIAYVVERAAAGDAIARLSGTEKQAQTICARAVSGDKVSSAIADAWQCWQRALDIGLPERALGANILAYQCAGAKSFAFSERHRMALFALDAWARQQAAPLRNIAQTLRSLSPVRQLPAPADDERDSIAAIERADALPSDNAIDLITKGWSKK